MTKNYPFKTQTLFPQSVIIAQVHFSNGQSQYYYTGATLLHVYLWELYTSSMIMHVDAAHGQ